MPVAWGWKCSLLILCSGLYSHPSLTLCSWSVHWITWHLSLCENNLHLLCLYCCDGLLLFFSGAVGIWLHTCWLWHSFDNPNYSNIRCYEYFNYVAGMNTHCLMQIPRRIVTQLTMSLSVLFNCTMLQLLSTMLAKPLVCLLGQHAMFQVGRQHIARFCIVFLGMPGPCFSIGDHLLGGQKFLCKINVNIDFHVIFIVSLICSIPTV